MALAVRSTWDPFTALVRQFDRDVFEGLTRSAPAAQGFVPAADVRKDGADVVLTLELPGVDVAKDVEVEVAERRLTISGRRHDEHSEEQGGLIRKEIRHGEFRREFSLPAGVTAEQIEADYDRGLLKVRIREVVKVPAAPAKIAIRGGETTERPAVEAG
ncbi:Hsp20/alpha crystallin family protein [Crossiella sp. CA-258035]|uniref:Hsp20/alpha crystallin family protein n=1 Tax=Crossiella sp. CA-258035 TaxID=2981138 RepID=UPI0024BCAA21|nr:Hsp20/alpha crystallin family protein [Crossiella sp. CA-258035]WHT19631.1 Hsp20/alpha crystallin family protein [Crossiella sp. CA-258035]